MKFWGYGGFELLDQDWDDDPISLDLLRHEADIGYIELHPDGYRDRRDREPLVSARPFVEPTPLEVLKAWRSTRKKWKPRPRPPQTPPQIPQIPQPRQIRQIQQRRPRGSGYFFAPGNVALDCDGCERQFRTSMFHRGGPIPEHIGARVREMAAAAGWDGDYCPDCAKKPPGDRG